MGVNTDLYSSKVCSYQGIEWKPDGADELVLEREVAVHHLQDELFVWKKSAALK